MARFNYEGYIENLGGAIINEYEKYFICEFKSFKFKAFKKLIRQGTFNFLGNMRACLEEDTNDYFRWYVKLVNDNENLDFSKTEFKTLQEKITVKCNEHGYFKTQATKMIDGCGCPKCYNKYKKPLVKNKGIENFIKEATERFDGKFDYSKVVYRNTMTKVTIICPTHGDFEQTPNEHLKSKYACKSCYQIYNSFKIEDYNKMCENGSSLYILKASTDGEKFYKVGITKNIKQRFKHYKYEGVVIDTADIYFHANASLIFSLEDDILLNNQCNKYVPSKKFSGYTECFTYLDTDEIRGFVLGVFKMSERNND